MTSSVPTSDRNSAGSKVDDLIGTVLNERYQILRLLNEGGMARIYVAKHTVLGREVAIKVLKGGCADDSDVVQRFINEGRAAGTLGHPHIVECTDIGTTADGRPYLVLELLAGHSLADEIIRSGPMPVGRAAKIASRIADALATAHGSGIVHRDLKSDNVFLSRKRGIVDWVKVLDFGVSKFSSEPVGTQKGSMLGTPDFMAPEQVVDAAAVDLRADIYALGVILYEMLAGRRPFHGIAFPMVLYAIAHEAPPTLESFRSDIPPDVLALVNKAMSKRPEDRHASMLELLAAVEPFADRVSAPDASMDDLVASSSARLSVVPLAELQLDAADERRRSSSSGAMPTTATWPNPGEKKTSFSSTTAMGIFALVGLSSLGIVAFRRQLLTQEAALSAATTAPANEIVEADVGIAPGDAIVEVDGRRVEVMNGTIKIKGAIGTVHHVHAMVGSNDARTDVVISLNGAMPSRVEVAVPKATPSVGTASASAFAPAAASAAPLERKAPGSGVPVLRDNR